MKWTSEDDNVLINGTNKPITQLMAQLGRDRNSVRQRILKLKKKGFVINPIIKKGKWSDEEIRIFNENIEIKTMNELCELLPHRSKLSIKTRSHRLKKYAIKQNVRGNKSFNFKGYKEISAHKFNSYKSNAKKRNIEFSVTIEYLWELLEKQNFKCAISGLPLTISSERMLFTASPDRIDNNLGYIKGNIQWVHKNVNFSKHTLSMKDFITLCKTIAEKWSNINCYN